MLSGIFYVNLEANTTYEIDLFTNVNNHLCVYGTE